MHLGCLNTSVKKKIRTEKMLSSSILRKRCVGGRVKMVHDEAGADWQPPLSAPLKASFLTITNSRLILGGQINFSLIPGM